MFYTSSKYFNYYLLVALADDVGFDSTFCVYKPRLQFAKGMFTEDWHLNNGTVLSLSVV